MSIELNDEQVYAVYDMETWWHKSTNQLFQVTGPAGCGKSTIIRYFIERLGLKFSEVLFLAYMGKAATRMAMSGLPARTIHSTIYDYVKVIDRDDDGKIIFLPSGKPKMVSKFIKKDKLDKKIKLIVVDEGSMVEEKVAKDLESFGIPMIILGDLNQLPPVFGNPYFLRDPDIRLTKIMRQAEDDPIVHLAREVLAGNELKIGVYGSSAVIPRSQINEYFIRKADIILTGTNRLRYNINNLVREKMKRIVKLDYPHMGEKIICRKNNWNKCIDDNFYMTNGTTGFVDCVYRDSFDGKTMTIDFRPDFSKKIFKNVTFDYAHLYEIPGQEPEQPSPVSIYNDKIEYAYAITIHTSQGSEWDNVLYFAENMLRNKEDNKKLQYTAITRAAKSIVIVI
jgi:exodeoxyribonuclease-5